MYSVSEYHLSEIYIVMQIYNFNIEFKSVSYSVCATNLTIAIMKSIPALKRDPSQNILRSGSHAYMWSLNQFAW